MAGGRPGPDAPAEEAHLWARKDVFQRWHGAFGTAKVAQVDVNKTAGTASVKPGYSTLRVQVGFAALQAHDLLSSHVGG